MSDFPANVQRVFTAANRLPWQGARLPLVVLRHPPAFEARPHAGQGLLREQATGTFERSSNTQRTLLN
ncbi:MAG: hypothetical protein HRJ53_18975 [Acidobacteria bacterium Pan2503]|uniref:Uncharacterized protein n=1 Tax=Candidatus Acidiferrum panamense TaxID=2741543 RepID=A0A7V8NTH1_9BACT|nr:hypothetical protein [Candidatus Acidoferrum panamensis]